MAAVASAVTARATALALAEEYHLKGLHDQGDHAGRSHRAPGPRPETGGLPPAKHIRVRGRDMSGDVRAQYEAVTVPGEFFQTADTRFDQASEHTFGTPLDAVLTTLVRGQGYGLPETVTPEEMDRRLANGWTAGYRGVRPYAGRPGETNADYPSLSREAIPAADAQEQVRQFREDPDFQFGSGIYGNGVYFSADPAVADTFAVADPDSPKRRTDAGATFRVAVDPAAKIVDYDDLQAEMKAWLADDANATPGNMMMVVHDPGRFAAMMGYDVIRVRGKQDGHKVGRKRSKADQFVVLNRGAVAMEAGT